MWHNYSQRFVIGVLFIRVECISKWGGERFATLFVARGRDLLAS